jgi:hypothetical protein
MIRGPLCYLEKPKLNAIGRPVHGVCTSAVLREGRSYCILRCCLLDTTARIARLLEVSSILGQLHARHDRKRRDY